MSFFTIYRFNYITKMNQEELLHNLSLLRKCYKEIVIPEFTLESDYEEIKEVYDSSIQEIRRQKDNEKEREQSELFRIFNHSVKNRPDAKDNEDNEDNEDKYVHDMLTEYLNCMTLGQLDEKMIKLMVDCYSKEYWKRYR